MSAPRSARALLGRASLRLFSAQLEGTKRLAATAGPLRGFATDSAAQSPAVPDAAAAKSLRTMLAHSWFPLEGKVQSEAKLALMKSSDAASREAVQAASAAAEAVEAFGEKLEQLRLELDELSGGKFGGEAVGSLPEHVKSALLSALRRYQAYLGSFSEDEEWLKRKVQEELGAQLLLVKQRCAGLETDWNQVSLLGTSGLAGSFIEKRA